MNPISVLIPDAREALPVPHCLTVSRRAIVHVMTQRPALALRYSRFCASVEELEDLRDVKHWLKRIGEIVCEKKIDVVLPIEVFGIRTLCKRSQSLGWAAKLPELPDPQTFEIVLDKATFADFLARQGIPQPPTVVVTTGIVQDVSEVLEFPVLVKPSISAGGVGIRRFDNSEELNAFLAARPANERWVVQTFIEGSDVCVNVLCQRGKICVASVQHEIKASSIPYRPAVGIEFRNNPQAMKVAERLVGALNWSGVAHIDLRYDAQRNIPLVLEVNPRYWYSLLGTLNAQVNYPLLACEMCLGELVSNRRPQRARYFSGWESAIVSLVGGGRSRIKPYETRWRFFDPFSDAILLIRRATTRARASTARRTIA